MRRKIRRSFSFRLPGKEKIRFCSYLAVLLLTVSLFGDLAVFFGSMSLPEGGTRLFNRAVELLLEEETEDLQESVSFSEPVSEEENTASKPEEEPYPQPPLEEAVSEQTVFEPEIDEENKAVLVHKTYTAGTTSIYVPLEKGYIKNCTSLSADEVKEAALAGIDFTVGTEGPQVLIMHTHTTECYMPYTGDYYDTTAKTRSTNNEENMVAVGEALAETLRAEGIEVIHDTTQHDYPSYNGSYDRSRVTVQQYLEMYPSICVVLDIHRDAIISGDTVVAPVIETEEGTAAQLMIISGCDDVPEYLKNLGFAASLQVALEKEAEGITRPVLFDYRKYNQDLTTGSLLVEVGGHGNTLEQATLSGRILGRALGKLLKEEMEKNETGS